MKKITVWLAVLLCTLGLTVSVSAEDIFVMDWADLLTDAEESALNAFLGGISEEAGANIVAASVDSLEGSSAQAYADDLYDTGLAYFGLGDGTEDGALFLIAMDERQWAVSTAGYGITALHEQALDHMEETIVPYLSEGAYYLAMQTFGEMCGAYWGADPYGYEGDYYDSVYGGDGYSHTVSGEDIYYGSGYGTERVHYGSSFGIQWVFISLIAGFLIALIPMGILKGQLNTVHMQTGAVSYQKKDSVRITGSRDLFLYRNVTKKPSPRNDPPRGGGSPGGSVHMGSSGRSHGGRSGGF